MGISTKDLEAEIDQLSDDSSADMTANLKNYRKQRQRKKKKEEIQDPSTTRDIIGWITILCSIAWLVTLISFDPSDPSFFHTTSKARPDNLLGKVGANISAWCYQFTGFGSFLFPMCSMYLGVLCIRSKKVQDWFFQVFGGLTVLLVFLTFLGSFTPFSIKSTEILPGGVIGLAFWRFFTSYLNPFGTYLFLFGAVGLAILVATQLSLREIWSYILAFSAWVGQHLMRLFQKIMDKREDSEREQMRQKIIERELDKMDATQIAKEKTKRRLRLKDDGELEDEPENEPTIHVQPEPQYDDHFEAGQLEEEIHPALKSDQFFTGDFSDEPLAPEPSVSSVPVPSSADSQQPPSRRKPDGQIKVSHAHQEKPNNQDTFQFVEEMENTWVFPNSYIFNPQDESQQIDEQELLQKAHSLDNKFGEFSVTGDMKEIHPGPVVTTYEFKPNAGIKYSKIVNLSEDLCLALGAESIRIDRMPGRSTIGLEVPNKTRELITFRQMIESDTFRKSKARLLFSLGKTIDGTPFFADLAKMPHLLIAGQTGSGKSVGINAMICSLLMRCRPKDTKLIMIDPKMVEMGIYGDIPHLLTPVVTDPLEASNALKWAVIEMERRYRLLAAHNFRNLEHFNQAVEKGSVDVKDGEEPLDVLPNIVIFIDEMADLMMVARGEVEESIARLAQKSRAIGIHLVLATQRPSVDIITGVIKSNLPSRLAYRVAQKNDSRIILDTNGAEKLLGRGDGLFLGPGTSRLVRIHAPYLSEDEVADLVRFLKNQGKPDYNHQILKPRGDEQESGGGKGRGKGKAKAGENKPKDDPMYEKAARLVVRSGQASVSYLQRKLGLGYARAAKLVDMMEEDGIVGPNVGSKARDILVPGDFFDEIDNHQ